MEEGIENGTEILEVRRCYSRGRYSQMFSELFSLFIVPFFFLFFLNQIMAKILADLCYSPQNMCTVVIFLFLQALNFSLGDKLSLSDLTVALENELLASKNGIHQAAVASFKAEIRHLL